jgi:hypothetical protein
MKTIRRMSRLTVCAVALLQHQLMAAESAASVDSVLSKFAEASGGKAALEKVNTMILKGTMESPSMNISSDFELRAKAPNKQWSKVEFPGMGAMIEGCDGKVAWATNSFQGLREKTGDELTKAIRDAYFQRPLYMKKIYPDLAYKGTEQVNGEATAVLESKPSPSSTERFYISEKTGLLIQQQSKIETPQGAVEANVNMSEYKPVDGVQYPQVIKTSVKVGDQQFAFNLKTTEIKHNQPVPDSLFAKP